MTWKLFMKLLVQLENSVRYGELSLEIAITGSSYYRQALMGKGGGYPGNGQRHYCDKAFCNSTKGGVGTTPY